MTELPEKKKLYPIGLHRETIPFPPVPEATTWFDAGALRIGVEFRMMDEGMIDEHFDTPEQRAMMEDSFAKAGMTAADIDFSGVSIHVSDAATDLEYLRFDDFDGDPHYHYIVPGSHHTLVLFDTNAEPDFLGWAVRVLSHRVKEMLAFAGADALAAAADQATVAAVLPNVAARIDAARQAAA